MVLANSAAILHNSRAKGKSFAEEKTAGMLSA